MEHSAQRHCPNPTKLPLRLQAQGKASAKDRVGISNHKRRGLHWEKSVSPLDSQTQPLPLK